MRQWAAGGPQLKLSHLFVALFVASAVITARARVFSLYTPLSQVDKLQVFGSACGSRQGFKHAVLRYSLKERLKPLQSMLAAGTSEVY